MQLGHSIYAYEMPNAKYRILIVICVLGCVFCRLEAATSRLEDLAAFGGAPAQAQAQPSSSYAVDTSKPTPVPPPAAPPAPEASKEIPPSVVAFDERIIEGKLKAFVDLTKSFAVQAVIDQVCTDYSCQFFAHIPYDIYRFFFNSSRRCSWLRRNTTTSVHCSFKHPHARNRMTVLSRNS